MIERGGGELNFVQFVLKKDFSYLARRFFQIRNNYALHRQNNIIRGYKASSMPALVYRQVYRSRHSKPGDNLSNINHAVFSLARLSNRL